MCACTRCKEMPAGVVTGDPQHDSTPFGGHFADPQTFIREPIHFGAGGQPQEADNLQWRNAHTSGAFAPLQLRHALLTRVAVVEKWNPYEWPVGAYDNPDPVDAKFMTLVDTHRPAQEYPRYRYSALDVEEIRSEAQRRVEARLRALRGR